MNLIPKICFVLVISCLYPFPCHGFMVDILRDDHSSTKRSLYWISSGHRYTGMSSSFSSIGHHGYFHFGYRKVTSELFTQPVGDVEGLQPRQLISVGMKKFAEMKINESIELFDKAEEKAGNGALTPFLWQRGISLYYANRFQEGSDQFRYDVKVNPFDAEEIVWDIACQNRLRQNDPNFVVRKMTLPQGKTDRRKIMRTVYSLFRGDGATEQDLAVAGHSGSPSDDFYALFYLGLYCESIGETDKAANYMRAAANSEYARGKGASDYMTVCAKVHCKLRNWP